MQENKIVNYIVLDLEQQHKVPYSYTLNRRIISDIVDGWDKKIYVITQDILNFRREKHKKYTLM